MKQNVLVQAVFIAAPLSPWGAATGAPSALPDDSITLAELTGGLRDYTTASFPETETLERNIFLLTCFADERTSPWIKRNWSQTIRPCRWATPVPSDQGTLQRRLLGDTAI